MLNELYVDDLGALGTEHPALQGLKQALLSSSDSLDESWFGCYGDRSAPIDWSPDEGHRASWLIDKCEPPLQKTNLLSCEHCSRSHNPDMASWELLACDLQLACTIEKKIEVGKVYLAELKEKEAAEAAAKAAEAAGSSSGVQGMMAAKATKGAKRAKK